MRGLGILLGAWACCSLGGNAHANPTPATTAKEVWAENDRAREQFRLGVNAFRAGRLDEARQLLTEAWRLRRTYDVAAALAQVENELGHHARAAELLDFCFNNFAPVESDSKFQQLRMAFDEVRSQVGQVDLSAVPPSAEVRVDDELVGSTPLGIPMYLEPGLHDFAFRVGARTFRLSLLVQAGAQHRLEVDPSRDKSDHAAKSTVGQVMVEGKSLSSSGVAPVAQRPSFPYYIGGTLFVAGAAAGVVFHLAANDAERRASDLERRPGVSVCRAEGTTSSELCKSLVDANAERVFKRNIAIFGYGIATTAAVATTIYWLWPDADPATVAAKLQAMTWTVGCAPTHVWIGTSGSFP